MIPARPRVLYTSGVWDSSSTIFAARLGSQPGIVAVYRALGLELG